MIQIDSIVNGNPLYNPLVSVIVPNYNHAAFLEERIESVINQSYLNIELIILDDCSSDNSRELIERYRSNLKVSHVVFNEVNGGNVFEQWKKGIELAKGEWLWIAESDDVATPDFLEVLLGFDGEIKYCLSQIIDENSALSQCYGFERMPEPKSYPEFTKSFTMLSDVFLNQWMLKDNFIPNASAVIIKADLARKVLNEIDYELSKMVLMGDWLFWLKSLQHAKSISFCEIPMNKFRHHSNTVRNLSAASRVLELHYLLRHQSKEHRSTRKSINTLLYRFFSPEFDKHRTFKAHTSLLIIAIKYNFLWLYCKTISKHAFKK